MCLPIQCAWCGEEIDPSDEVTSTPIGSCHADCAYDYESEHPDEW